MESKVKSIKIFSMGVVFVFMGLFMFSLVLYISEVVRRYSEFPDYSLLNDERMFSPFQLSFMMLLILVIAGFGMFKLKKWAKTLYLVLITFVCLAYGLFVIIALHSNIITIVIPLVVGGYSYFFLTHPQISEKFE